MNTVSGDIELEAAGNGARVNSVSGDVHVASRPGLALWIDVQSVSGSVHLRPRRRRRAGGRSRARGAADRTVSSDVRTVSGDVRITRAGSARR